MCKWGREASDDGVFFSPPINSQLDVVLQFPILPNRVNMAFSRVSPMPGTLQPGEACGCSVIECLNRPVK